MRFRTLLTTASAVALGIGLMAGSASAGDDNKLYVNQINNRNFASTDQDPNNNGSSDNETFVRQQHGNTASVPIGVGSPSFDNDVLILQETIANHAGTGNSINGNHNRWVVKQQGGNRNIVFGPIWGSSNRSEFAAVQDGGQNVIAGAAGNAGFGTGIDETGSHPPFTNSFSSVSLDGPAPMGVSTGQDRIEFKGNDNLALLEQTGSFNRFAIQVNGDNNSIVGDGSGMVSSFDMNAANNAGGFFDSGISIDATLDSTNTPALGSGFASQVGNNNTAHYAQLGDHNRILHDQIGNGNEAQVFQQGSTNWAGATQ